MGYESDDVSEMRCCSSDVCCSRKCGVVICAFCEKIMHKFCAKRMEYIKFIFEFHMNCCQSCENIGTLLQKSEVEILLESANENNEILKVNNALLLHRIQEFESNTSVIQKKANKHHESIDNSFEHKVEIPRIKIDKINDCLPEAVTGDSRNLRTTENIYSSNSATGNLSNSNKSTKKSVIKQIHKVDQGINLDQTGASNSKKQTPHTKEPEEVVWTKVQKKKSEKQKQKSNLLCMGSRQFNPESKIRGALRRKWLYVGKIYGSNVTENDMKEFLRNMTNTNNFEVKKLPTQGNNYAFSIGIPSDALFLELSKPQSWPSGVVLREFNFKNFFREDPIPAASIK
ncbi:hypothetical protein WA026_011290 [Henosepilachna vigintioctopunctata]|uniref:Zinc finger PHD-type domain-containing protein n=1 Tax=Henosepilachna vigintioctopunctata TaxID=420089 RepID=A0AAW1U0V3_9CUCU